MVASCSSIGGLSICVRFWCFATLFFATLSMLVLMSLLDLDYALFDLINKEWTSMALDYLLPLWRNKLFWIPVYFFIVSYMVVNYRLKGYYFVLFLLLSVGTADLVSSQAIKKTVQRVRPCREPMMMDERVLVRCGHGYSFTSSHAANHFTISMFLIFSLGSTRRGVKPVLFLWAASVAYAQVYVGVHYPLDIIAGALLGTVIAGMYSWLFLVSKHQLPGWIDKSSST